MAFALCSGPRVWWTPGMQVTEAITITLLGTGLLLLFMLLVAVWRVGGSLLRLERLLADQGGDSSSNASNPSGHSPLPRPAETAEDGAFGEFLAENPERRKLPKREQAEAYRQWRRNRGLNWSAP